MKALILNSGTGSRMGEMTHQCPKCMTMLSKTESILSRQLRQLHVHGVKDVIITTGPFEDMLKAHCNAASSLHLNTTFVHNPDYKNTNYIYSIYKARELLDDDIILMHGDLVFTDAVLARAMDSPESCMIVSSTAELPEKDFKAVVTSGPDRRILKVGIEFFENALTAQPLYKILKKDCALWLKEIFTFCKAGNCKCYAEKALNLLTEPGKIILRPLDITESLCGEIDTPEDWIKIKETLRALEGISYL